MAVTLYLALLHQRVAAKAGMQEAREAVAVLAVVEQDSQMPEGQEIRRLFPHRRVQTAARDNLAEMVVALAAVVERLLLAQQAQTMVREAMEGLELHRQLVGRQ